MGFLPLYKCNRMYLCYILLIAKLLYTLQVLTYCKIHFANRKTDLRFYQVANIKFYQVAPFNILQHRKGSHGLQGPLGLVARVIICLRFSALLKSAPAAS
jgi:hypothetical protein